MALPNWPSAGAVYSRAYRTLELMRARGDVTVSHGRCYPSDDMRALVDALNAGDEEQIKGLLLLTHVYPYGGT